MYHEDYSYWGMHFVWWVIWGVLLIWIFATPYDIPGQRIKRDTPLEILKKRFASGQITESEFKEIKKTLES